MKKVFGIGIGPGDPELLTLKAHRLITECDYVFIPESKGESLAGHICRAYISDKKVIGLSFPMGEVNVLRYKQAAELIDNTLKENEIGVFLTLGDAMTYSTYIYLAQELNRISIETETIPGITSYHAAAAILGHPITIRDESFYLADGDVDEAVLRKINTVCVLKVSKNKSAIIEKLEQAGFEYAYVKRCTQDTEKVLYKKHEILGDNDYMSLIYARRK